MWREIKLFLFIAVTYVSIAAMVFNGYHNLFMELLK